MIPITRDEMDDLERKAKAAGEMTPCVVVQSDPDDFGETDWFIWFNKAGFYGGKADTSMMDEPTARYIAAALESVPRLIARIRELERDRRLLMARLFMCPCPECLKCICSGETCVNRGDGRCLCDEVFEQGGAK